MARRHRNPFKDRRASMGAEEDAAPDWLPTPPYGGQGDADVVATPSEADLAWRALREVIPAAHTVIGVLELCHQPDVRTLAADAGNAIDRVTDWKMKRPGPRSVLRWDFTAYVKAFRQFAALVGVTSEEHLGHVPGYELLDDVRTNLVTQLRACEKSFVGYTKAMKRLKAMERLGMGRNR